MTLDFFVPCVPPTTTHQHKKIVRIGKGSRLADKPELVNAKAFLDAVLVSHSPSAPLQGAVSLSLRFSWPYRKSEPKKNRLAPMWMTSRPDCTNLAKTIEDRLVALRFIEDDNAVTILSVSKTWSDTPGIRITLSECEGMPYR